MDDQPFAARLKFIDRILQVSNERSDQLQYRGAKALQYFLVGDTATAKFELDAAIHAVRESESEKPLDDYERHMLGRLLQMLASLRDDRELLMEAIGQFNVLLLADKWTKSGRALLHREIGTCHKYAGAWRDAEQAYREALSVLENPLDRVHLAEALLYQKQIEAAHVEIAKVDRTALSKHEYEDYVFAFAAIAIWLGRDEALKEARVLLEQLKTIEPYFNERRLTLLLAVQDALASGTVSGAAKVESTPKGGIASAASSFFILQPNIMGIGINFNAVIDYLLKKKPSE